MNAGPRLRWPAGCVPLVAAGIVAVLASEPQPFPPLPTAGERVAKNDAEREAGVVILEAESELLGEIKIGAIRLKGSTTTRNRRRYLVLDARGAERIARHAFFGEIASDIQDLRGRTVSAEGQEFPLDPQKDVHNLDLRDPTGKPRGAVRSAFFPNVAPGAILDVAWRTETKELPEFQWLPLQSEFPIRHRTVKSRGQLIKISKGQSIFGRLSSSWYWVPYFIGAAPPRAHATLDGEFNLDLDIRDIEPYLAEPYAPPFLRKGYALGLMPRPVDPFEKLGASERRKCFVLFGAQGRERMTGQEATVSQDIDPGGAFVQLDPLGLQPVPVWQSDKEMMRWHQSLLRQINKDFHKFLRSTGEAESPQEVAAIAPADLPWRERARRLFDHVRSRAKPDPEAERQTRLRDLLEEGRGSVRDVTLYLAYLYKQAGLTSHIVAVFSRYAVPFQPFVESLSAFNFTYLIEVGSPGETPLYVMPGIAYSTSATLDPAYLGGLAFRQPDLEDDDWPLVRIAESLPVTGSTEIAFSAPFDPARDEVQLTMRSTLLDAAAYSFRWRLGRPKPEDDAQKVQERRQTVYAWWVDRWANVELSSPPPNFDPQADPAAPVVFDVVVPWKSDLQPVGERFLLPALPRADLFRNLFTAEKRTAPVWFDGGEWKVQMTWQLPPGAALDQGLLPVEGRGPLGLEFSLEVHAGADRNAGRSQDVTTTLRLRLPSMLPPSEYAGVRRFFEDLQRAADTRILVRLGGTG